MLPNQNIYRDLHVAVGREGGDVARAEPPVLIFHRVEYEELHSQANIQLGFLIKCMLPN